MKNALAGNRRLQAATEVGKAARITAMLIQVDPGTLGVARVVGNETKTRSANEPNSHSKLGHKTEATYSHMQDFLREHDGVGLISYHSAPLYVVWVEICAPSTCCPSVTLTECLATFETTQHSNSTRPAKDSQPRGVWLG